MSARVPPSFRALGLTRADASRADVRKAYAARLRQIDPDAERAAFEALRAAYETALILVQPAQPPSAAAPPPADAQPLADAAYEAALEPAVEPPRAEAEESFERLEILRARLRAETEEPNEALRIISVLKDPALNDPLLARAIENDIYDFFCERIEIDADGAPKFRFRRADAPHFNANRTEVMQLLRRLDRQFGWLSDTVRMRQNFPNFNAFLLATTTPVAQPTSKIRLDFKAKLWIALAVVVWVLNVTLNHRDTAPQQRYAPPAAIGQYSGEIGEDYAFLASLHGPPKPSAGTGQFLARLAQEQHLQGETTTDVKLFVLRNALVREVAGPMNRSVFDAYSNPDELKYLLGVLIATRYQLHEGLAYRNILRFRLVLQEGSDLARWVQLRTAPDGSAPDGPEVSTGAAGYVFETGEDTATPGYLAAYSAEFVNAMRKQTNGDARALEGALGLSFRAFERFPKARLLLYPQMQPPQEQDALLSLSRHGLVRAGLDENRWPIRAMVPVSAPCAWPAAELLDRKASWDCPAIAPAP